MLSALPPLPRNARGRSPTTGTAYAFKPQRKTENEAEVEVKHCYNFSTCGPERLPPILGRCGGIYPPKKKFGPYTLPRPDSPRGCTEEGTPDSPKTSRRKRLPALGPTTLHTLKGHTGPYNLMWDPHICRGTNIIHFDSVEKKKCDEYWKRKDLDKIRSRPRRKVNPLFGESTGYIAYPAVTLPVKNACTDFSMFLEEQDCEERPKLTIHTQTEDGDLMQQNPEVDLHTIVKHEWISGIDVGTQGEWCEIAKETKSNPAGSYCNPRQYTMNRVAMIIASQINNQSILDEMECAELSLIRGECEKVNLWIAQEHRRRFAQQREACKRLGRIECEKKIQMAEEGQIQICAERVAANCCAKNFITTLFERSFAAFQREGLVGPRAKAETKVAAGREWIEKNVDVYFRNKKLARGMVDDVIVEVSKKRWEDHKAFLQRPDISSSLEVQVDQQERDEDDPGPPTPLENNQENYTSENNQPEEVPEVKVDKVDPHAGRRHVVEEDKGPHVVKLMEPNPRFNLTED